jgi:uncharacterized membrane protein YczE
MSGIGLRVMDLVAIAAMRRFGCSFLTARMGLEAGFFMAALLLGGSVGFATVAFLLLVVPLMPSFMWARLALPVPVGPWLGRKSSPPRVNMSHSPPTCGLVAE